MSLAGAIKPPAFALFLPLLYLWWQRFGLWRGRTLSFAGYVLISLIPSVLWSWQTGWLLNRGDLVTTFHQYLFSTLFFKKIFLQWPAELWVGWVLVAPFLIGAWWLIRRKEGGVWLAWIVGALVTLALTAAYSRQHDYYSLVLVPPCAVISAYGLRWLFAWAGARTTVVVAVIIVAAAGALIRIHQRFGDTAEFYRMREDSDRLIPMSSRVVVEDKSNGAIRLYQINRRGWFIRSIEEVSQIDDRVRQGAEFLVLEDSLGPGALTAAALEFEPVGWIGPTFCYRIQPSDSLR
jgi:hypothetical protein